MLPTPYNPNMQAISSLRVTGVSGPGLDLAEGNQLAAPWYSKRAASGITWL